MSENTLLVFLIGACLAIWLYISAYVFVREEEEEGGTIADLLLLFSLYHEFKEWREMEWIRPNCSKSY